MSSSLLTSEFWEYFNSIQNQAFETFGQETITLKKSKYNLSRWQEDSGDAEDEFELSCIINYNYYRVWGVNKNSQTGESEKPTIVAIFNRNNLIENHPTLVDDYGNMLFDAGRDYFIHRGLRYTPQGDTFLSQDSTNPILFMVILQRDSRETGTSKGNQE